MNENYTLINPVIIQQNMMHNTDLIRQFLQLYLDQIPTDFLALTDAMTSGSKIDISHKAHHIKPTMEYIGATELRDAFQELETAAKHEADILTLQKIFSPLQEQSACLISEITHYLNSL